MTARRPRMLADLPSSRSQPPRPNSVISTAVYHLAQHYRRAPDQLSEADL